MASIVDQAFYNCYNLTSITIPNSVTSIGDSAFNFCTILTEITISNSVTSIGGYAFSWCYNLTSITIPNSVTRIKGGAFYYCAALKEVICKPTTPPTGGSDMFNGISSSAKIYVPAGSGYAYRSAQYWSNYADMIVEM